MADLAPLRAVRRAESCGDCRAGGDLTRSLINAALRSCYPDFVAKKKAVALVEETFPVENMPDDVDVDADFQDVQEFLNENQVMCSLSWKEKRAELSKELSKLQKSRQFGKAKELRRYFRVEVEELKAKTVCHRCGRRGHWARECSSAKGSGKGGKSAPSTSAASGAGMVATEEHDTIDFIAAVTFERGLLDRMRSFGSDWSIPSGSEIPFEVVLVSCPGYCP